MAAEPARKRARTKAPRGGAPRATAPAEAAAPGAGKPPEERVEPGLAARIKARLQEAAAGAPAPAARAAVAPSPPLGGQPAAGRPPATPAAASAPGGAAIAAAATSTPPGGDTGGRSGLCFLRLSAKCQPSKPVKTLVYLDRDEVSFGRLPTCTVVLDSDRAPQMISRAHAHVRRHQSPDAVLPEQWKVDDNKSTNGILVNGAQVGSEGHILQAGDVVTFGRKMEPPEFEFVFEAADSPKKQQAPPAVPLEELFGANEEIRKLKEELAAERQQKEAEALEQKQASDTNLNLTDELHCSICQDFMVQAATIECSHTFCWSCIDQWLRQKKFECPECRADVTREPVRTRAIENIVQKAVNRLADDKKAEYDARVVDAEARARKAAQLHEELEKSVTQALQKKQAFFHIDSSWSRKEKETFQRGVKDYSNDTRETYCKLTGLTCQWVYSATDAQLNQALHNLALATHVSDPEDKIRQRLLMFLRYG